MTGNRIAAKMLRNYLKRLYLSISLAVTSAACQTTPPVETSAKEQAVLDAQVAIVRNALDNGKPDAALQSLRGMLREHPNDSNLNTLMGLTQLSLKNPGRAVRHLQIAFRATKQVSTGLNLSSAYIEAGDHAKAIQLLGALLKQADRDRYPYKERIFHNLGYAHLRQAKPGQAEQAFKEAVEENPTFFPSHLELARLYEKTKRTALAMKTYRTAIDYCTVCFEPVKALASLYIQAGRNGEARGLALQFAKIEGTSANDRAAADEIVRLATTSGLNRRKGRLAQGDQPPVPRAPPPGRMTFPNPGHQDNVSEPSRN